jgi:hypothetical protein
VAPVVTWGGAWVLRGSVVGGAGAGAGNDADPVVGAVLVADGAPVVGGEVAAAGAPAGPLPEVVAALAWCPGSSRLT